MEKKEVNGWIKEEKKLLQSRFNFFLLGTAFLIAAFAAVLTFTHDAVLGTRILFKFTYAINIAGFWIALFFGLDNFVCGCRIRAEEVKRKQDGRWNIPQWRKEFHMPETLCRLIIQLSQDFFRFVWSPLNYENRAPYVHTWLVPLGFAIFWLTTWGLILPHWKVASIILFLPVIYLLSLFIYSCAESQLRRLTHNKG